MRYDVTEWTWASALLEARRLLTSNASRLALAAIVFGSASLGPPRPAAAINIILSYNAASSVEPAADPTGAILTSLFQHAETFYQDVFEDTHTLTINYWWENLSAGTLGVHNLVSQAGGRETVANIRIDNNTSWFLDPTPANDSEFTMTQTLWRDLTGAQQSDLYNNFGASTPATFEVGYTGTANAGGPAAGVWDALSVVMHEVGHALGMSSANNSTIAETADNDYDFNSAFVFGQPLAAEVADGGNIAHLDGSGFALMVPSVPSGLRRLPSHTDLFSMASGHSYVDLDVPRREFYGGSDWNTDGNWSGDTVPGAADDVYVRDPGAVVTANLSAAGFAANLFVREGGNINTQGFKLDIGGTASISDVNSDIFVSTGGELEAATVTILNDAELNVNGGLVDAGTITVTQGTTVTFLQGTDGTVDVQTTLNNNATIRALGGTGTLTFTSSGGAVWDLDGTGGNGVVQAVEGNLTFASGSLADEFDGDMDVGNGSAARTLTIAEPWTLGAGGIIDMSGGAAAADRAAINGGTMTANAGDLNANAGFVHINAPVDLGGTFDATVADGATLEFNGAANIGGGDYIANGAGEMEFDGVTTYTGGTLTVSGNIQQNGDATVTGDTTINGERFDMDGDLGASVDWSISNADLILNVDSVESVGTGGTFNGTITVDSGSIVAPASLTINLTGGGEWTMAGVLNTNGTADPFIVATLGAGTPFNLTGTANVSGNNSWGSRVDISGTVNTADANATVRLTGGSIADPNRLLGGTITGPGTVSATANDALVGNGTIDADISFSSNAELRADNGTLNVTGSILDVGIIGTADSDGILNVTNAWNTGVATELRLNGGEVTGAAITNDGTTIGFGEITSTGFNNSGQLSGDGGTLILNTTNFPDLDGGSDTGVINAVAGNVQVIPGGGSFAFNGTLNIGSGREFRMNTNGLRNLTGASNGTVNMTGGAMIVTSFEQSSRLNVNAGGNSLISAATIDFQAGGLNTINSVLRLQGSTRVFNGASFAGTGALGVDNGFSLNLQDGASVGVTVINNGTTAVGFSTGIATVNAFTQTAAGTFEVEIDGTTAGLKYDRLVVLSAASLNGAVDVQVNQNGGTYTDPSVAGTFDEFTILLAASVTGTFSQFDYDGGTLSLSFSGNGMARYHVGNGLFRILDYDATQVDLLNYQALGGDANGDGVVDGQDFIIWNTNKFTAGTDWTTGDFNGDGITDGQDFIVWNSNKFTSIPLGIRTSNKFHAADGLTVTQIPEPSAAIPLATALLLVVRRRRR